MGADSSGSLHRSNLLLLRGKQKADGCPSAFESFRLVTSAATAQ